MTERMRIEKALQESEDRFRRLAENTQDVVYRYELSPRPGLSYVSPATARMVGYTPEELYADPELPCRLMHPKDRHLLEAALADKVTSTPVVMRWMHKTGGVVWTELRNVPIHDAAGNLVAVEGTARDVTKQRQMEMRLRRAQRMGMAGRIAAEVAHDFKNLLVPLAACPELIKAQLPEDHPAVPLCNLMIDAAGQIAAVNDQMLALGRRGHFEQEPTDLNLVVRQAVAQMGQVGAGLELRWELQDDLLPVKGGAAQLLRVVSNLVANARDAMEDVGLLRLKTENYYLDRPLNRHKRVEMGEYVKFSVIDTGCGIPAEIKNNIFDAFFTTKRTGTKLGSGLGLSAVKTIVEDHRGYVDLESEVGVGTAFYVYLPSWREPLSEAASKELPRGSEAVLIVDDDRHQREVVVQQLQVLGYRVDAVASGEEALVYLAERDVDLIILDMIMSGMDGAETYRRIVKIRPGQRAITTSGLAETERVQAARRLGAKRYLRKPVVPGTLAWAVRKELDREQEPAGDLPSPSEPA